jgi:hypothetical protein
MKGQINTLTSVTVRLSAEFYRSGSHWLAVQMLKSNLFSLIDNSGPFKPLEIFFIYGEGLFEAYFFTCRDITSHNAYMNLVHALGEHEKTLESILDGKIDKAYHSTIDRIEDDPYSSDSISSDSGVEKYVAEFEELVQSQISMLESFQAGDVYEGPLTIDENQVSDALKLLKTYDSPQPLFTKDCFVQHFDVTFLDDYQDNPRDNPYPLDSPAFGMCTRDISEFTVVVPACETPDFGTRHFHDPFSVASNPVDPFPHSHVNPEYYDFTFSGQVGYLGTVKCYEYSDSHSVPDCDTYPDDAVIVSCPKSPSGFCVRYNSYLDHYAAAVAPCFCPQPTQVR